jgi:molybdenum cofactor cytidylyltransferase
MAGSAGRGGVLLAAGGGRRYLGEGHKLLASYHGRPLVAAALDALVAGGFDALAVVSGAVDLRALVPEGVTLLENPDWDSGLSSSLRRALEWARALDLESIVVGLGDMPGVPASAWRAVGAAEGEVAVASFDGALRPPVLLGRSVWDEVPTSGDIGARELWKRPGAIHVACEGSPIDIDTPEDLRALEAADEAGSASR